MTIYRGLCDWFTISICIFYTIKIPACKSTIYTFKITNKISRHAWPNASATKRHRAYTDFDAILDRSWIASGTQQEAASHFGVHSVLAAQGNREIGASVSFKCLCVCLFILCPLRNWFRAKGAMRGMRFEVAQVYWPSARIKMQVDWVMLADTHVDVGNK